MSEESSNPLSWLLPLILFIIYIFQSIFGSKKEKTYEDYEDYVSTQNPPPDIQEESSSPTVLRDFLKEQRNEDTSFEVEKKKEDSFNSSAQMAQTISTDKKPFTNEVTSKRSSKGSTGMSRLFQKYSTKKLFIVLPVIMQKYDEKANLDLNGI